MDEFDARRVTTDLVTAYLSNNSLPPADLPKLLTQVFNAIAGFGAQGTIAGQIEGEPSTPDAPALDSQPVEGGVPEPVATAAPEAKSETAGEPANAVQDAVPAVSIEESISNPDFILSLITGEKLKTLRRHLKAHGLTDAEYRARYKLPADYPFVAPSYSQTRRDVAKAMGLGRKVDLKAALPAPAITSTPPAPAKAVTAPPAQAKRTKVPAPTSAKTAQEPKSPKSRDPRTKAVAKEAAAPSPSDSKTKDKASAAPKKAAKASTKPAKAPIPEAQTNAAATAAEKPKAKRRGKLSVAFS